jgi:hypothetical protein
VLEHLVGVDEQHLEALPTCLLAQRLGDVRLDAPIDMPPLGRILSAT